MMAFRLKCEIYARMAVVNGVRLTGAAMHGFTDVDMARCFGVRWLVGLVALGGLAGCATPEVVGPASRETVWAITVDHQLIRSNGGQPQRVLERKAVTGLSAGERLLGMDYRVARGVLYAVSNAGRVYTLDTATGALRGISKNTLPLAGQAWGMDFNPVADRIRLVSNTGQNLRLHPDTGDLVDFDPQQAGIQPDPSLSYAPGDQQSGRVPQVVAAAYTYNKRDDKLTTNFAIDRSSGTLVTQGSREGAQPVVSPNSGRLFTVGPLGLGALRDVAFDIADVDNAALAAITTDHVPRTTLYRIDLSSGRAQRVGQVGDGTALLGMAIEP